MSFGKNSSQTTEQMCAVWGGVPTRARTVTHNHSTCACMCVQYTYVSAPPCTHNHHTCPCMCGACVHIHLCAEPHMHKHNTRACTHMCMPAHTTYMLTHAQSQGLAHSHVQNHHSMCACIHTAHILTHAQPQHECTHTHTQVSSSTEESLQASHSALCWPI